MGRLTEVTDAPVCLHRYTQSELLQSMSSRRDEDGCTPKFNVPCAMAEFSELNSTGLREIMTPVATAP